MNTVTPIVTRAQIEEAWEAYAAKRREEIARPALVDDDAHKAQCARLYADWRRLYLQTEHSN